MRIIWSALFIASLFIVWFFLKLPASAHMPDRPDLDRWFMQLRSKYTLCCDFSEAEKISDPDWSTENGHYRVFLEGKWWAIEDNAVVTEPNRYGPALAWPIRYPSGGPIIGIRCFLPGAGT